MRVRGGNRRARRISGAAFSKKSMLSSNFFPPRGVLIQNFPGPEIATPIDANFLRRAPSSQTLQKVLNRVGDSSV
jgi:hypothetical protein